jgi:hypothetical protein
MERKKNIALKAIDPAGQPGELKRQARLGACRFDTMDALLQSISRSLIQIATRR